uniref:Uncharacterized protein n=1 Tax=Opuntia streptacantha TaxID=393608 RepID=A0A7C9ESZ9_OPUST
MLHGSYQISTLQLPESQLTVPRSIDIVKNSVYHSLRISLLKFRGTLQKFQSWMSSQKFSKNRLKVILRQIFAICLLHNSKNLGCGIHGQHVAIDPVIDKCIPGNKS